jgi:hypothetical protein
VFLQSSVRGRGETVGKQRRSSVAIFVLRAVVRLERQIPREHFNRNLQTLPHAAKRAGIFLFTFLFHFPTSSCIRPYILHLAHREANALSEHPSQTPAQPFVSYLFPLFHPDNLIFCTPVATLASNDDKPNSRRRLDVCFRLVPFKRCM